MSAAASEAPGGAAGTAPGYRFREDVAPADAAFEAWAPTLEGLFVAAADATTGTMVEDLASVEARLVRAIRLEEESADLLLVRFLEELIFLKDAEGLLLRVPAVAIREGAAALALEAEARGEPIDPRRHRLGIDVKAVTLHRLRVERTAQGWEASVVLDV